MRYALLTVALMGCASTEPVEEPALQVAVETQALENMEEILALQDRVTELEALALQVESMTTEYECDDSSFYYQNTEITVDPAALVSMEVCNEENCINVDHYVRTDNTIHVPCSGSRDFIRLHQVVPVL